ncbi:MAG TPA: ATP-binding protein [Solirubrobacteraceae bacterium]|nr:ATP-binding protein [Solirubrobacteraceae bacterium]
MPSVERAAAGRHRRGATLLEPPTAPTRWGWLSLLAMTRLLGAVVAVVLLAVHQVSRHDPALIVLTLGWTALSLAIFARSEEWQRRPWAWALDAAAAIALVWLSEDWRSPFYVFALTTLVLPATSLPFRPALLWACAFTAAYLAVAIETELDAGTLRSSIRVETVATHLMVPIVVALALAYAAELLKRLHAERERSERLAIQTERQRIAWELHDSAKQRVHAAHLVLSAAVTRAGDGVRGGIEHALTELGAAAADMDTSVAELRAPLDSRPVDDLLRRRARELEAAAGATIDVSGSLPPLSPLVAVHTYRIASEALTNAVRHSGARRIGVTLSDGPGGGAIVVADDGVGMPLQPRPGSHGLRTMRSRAESIGGRLEIGTGDGGGGTVVALSLPPECGRGAEP